MTLHEAIHIVIKELSAGSSAYEQPIEKITKEINNRQLYSRKDKQPIPTHQVIARIRAYPKQFFYNVEKKRVKLLDPDNMVVLERAYAKIIDAITEEVALISGSKISYIHELILGITALISNSKRPKILFKYLEEVNKDLFIKEIQLIQNNFEPHAIPYKAWTNLIEKLEQFPIKLLFPILAKFSAIDFENMKWEKGSLDKKAFIFTMDAFISKKSSNYFENHITPPFALNGFWDVLTQKLISYPYQSYGFATPSFQKKNTNYTIYNPVAGAGNLMYHIINKGIELETGGLTSETNNKSDLAILSNKFVLQDLNLEALFSAYFSSVINESIDISFYCDDSSKEIPVAQKTVDIMLGDIPPSNNKDGKPLEISLIEQSFSLLKPDGIGIFLLSEKFFYTESSPYKALRKRLVTENLIERIVQFKLNPNDKYSHANKILLVLNKAKKDSSDSIIFEQFRPLEPQEENNNPSFRSLRTEKKQEVKTQKIVGNNFLLTPKRYLSLFDESDYVEPLIPLKNYFLKTNFEKAPPIEIYPFLSIKNLNKKEEITSLSSVNITLPKSSKSGKLIKEDVLLLASIGNRLRPSYFNFENTPITVSPNVFVRKINKLKVLPEYLISELNRAYISEQVEAFSIGSTMPLIKAKDLNNIKIIHRTIAEQKEVLTHRKEVEMETPKNNVINTEYGLLSSLEHTIGQYLTSLNTNLASLENVLNETIDWEQRTSPNPDNPRTVRDTYSKILSATKDIGESFDTVKTIIDFDNNKLEKKRLNIKDFLQHEVNNRLNEADNIDFKIVHDETLQHSDFEMEFDPAQFKILINNFIDNSIKHGFKTQVFNRQISIILTPDTENSTIVMDLFNNGTSLTIPFKDFIKPFKTTDMVEGSGLGGYLMNKIVENHQGEFSLINKIDHKNQKGLTFRITLPYEIN